MGLRVSEDTDEIMFRSSGGQEQQDATTLYDGVGVVPATCRALFSSDVTITGNSKTCCRSCFIGTNGLLKLR